MYMGLNVKYPSNMNVTSVFLIDFRKILTPNFTKILPVGTEFYAD